MIPKLLRGESLALPLALVLLGVFAVVFSHNIVDPDLWGHVRYGQHMIEQGKVFETDPYSYLSGGVPWINHELVCEFTLGFLEPRVGATGLLVWKILMGVLTLAPVIWVHRDKHYEPLTIVLVAVLLAQSLWPGWTLRPQLFTYLFMSCLGLIMTQHSQGHWKALALVPLLVIAWTNAHGGFVAGLAIFGVHVSFECCSQMKQAEPGWPRRILTLLGILALSLLVTIVNPYGTGLLTWIWDSLTWPRPEIHEWWPVTLWSWEYFSFKIFVTITVLSLILTRRPRSWKEMTILGLAAVQAFMHRRHIPLFAILAACWLPEHLEDFLARVRAGLIPPHTPGPSRGTLRLYAAGFVALATLFLGLTTVQTSVLRVERSVYPVEAFEFIERHQLEGRMVTEFNWGQYCLYSFWPRLLVSVDGRFDTSYSREILDLNLDFIMGDIPRWRNRSPSTGPFVADRILDLGEPNLALVDLQRPECVKVIERRADWVLLYQDAQAQIWGRY